MAVNNVSLLQLDCCYKLSCDWLNIRVLNLALPLS